MRAHPEIDALLAELLDSGVSPKYISRLASELDDHYFDLEAEARRLGVPESEAAEDARARLGAYSAIATEFARRPELKSWVYTSAWMQKLLRGAGLVCLLVSAPARAVAGGQEAMLRYTAATAAGTSVTCGILLMLTALLSPDSSWGGKLAEQAGAALGVWQLDHGAPGSALLWSPQPAPARGARPDVGTRTPLQPREADRPSVETSAQPFDVATREPALPTPVGTRPAVLDAGDASLTGPPQLLQQSRPVLDDAKVRITLTELEPAAHLGIGDQDLSSVTDVEPVYPWAAARRGIEGYAVVEYTVTRAGTVADPVVVESSHALFERSALDAARTLTYRPRTIQGQPVDVRGVRILIRFELEA